MRTCASPISNRLRPTSGFSLLEVLVVISIMAIMTGMVVLGFGGADRNQRDVGLAEDLQQRFELARQRSLQRNKTWGVVIEPDGYRFAEYDVVNEQWVEQSQRPFTARSIDAPMQLRVEVEGETLVTGSQASDEGEAPDILFFASGEATPFTLELRNTANDARWLLECDGFSTVSMARDEA